MTQILPPQLQEERRDDYYISHDSLSLRVLRPPIATTGICSRPERKPRTRRNYNVLHKSMTHKQATSYDDLFDTLVRPGINRLEKFSILFFVIY